VSKDLLVTVGGVLALGAVLFGAGMFIAGTALQDSASAKPATETKPEDEHGAKPDAHGKAAEHKDDHGKKKEDPHAEKKSEHGDAHVTNEDTKASNEGDEEYVQTLERKFNDHFARGMYDDARSMAMKARNLAPNSAAWQRRLADATFMSEDMAAQQRFQKAYELYSALIVNDPTPRESEWPRYRAVLCLRNQNRWEEAAQAADAYLALYKSTPRAIEILLLQAQCQFALGDRQAAKKNIEKLLALEIPKDQRAAAMLELAHIERETPPPPATTTKASSDDRAEVINVNDLEASVKKTVAHEEPAPEPKPELSPLIPKAQWEIIRHAANTGNLLEAQRLISPWLDPTGPLTATQRARIALDYASLLRELANAAQKQ